jgi:hypothetical protein
MAQSAQGLFKATGNSAKPRTVRLLDGSYQKTEAPKLRAADDFTPTPPDPTRALLFYERERLSAFPLIWEAACGDGRMQRDIEAGGHKCIGSDLRDRGCGAIIKDFFAFREPLSSCIITNPPHDQINQRDGKGRWVWHAMDVLKVEYMAVLLNWSWPGAAGLGKLWYRHPPARAYLMRWKIDFTGEGAPPMLNGWFIWDRKHVGECRLLMMDRRDVRQGRLLEVPA